MIETTAPIMRAILGPGGTIAQHLPGYEPREPQLRMADIVAEAICMEQHCLVEAGTGVGKSLAYLIPTIYSDRKTIVSTADKGLQEQLWQKDIPFLQDVLPVRFQAAILKGIANYLCIDRWNKTMRQGRLFGDVDDTKKTVNELIDWRNATECGDLEELSFALTPDLARRITATSDNCLKRRCPCFNKCHFETAKQKARDADIIIVNHPLLTLDVALRRKTDGQAGVLPDRDLVIVDEAHRLEEAATRAFETECSAGGVTWLLMSQDDIFISPALVENARERAELLFGALGRLSKSQTYAVNRPTPQIQAMAEGLAGCLRGIARDLRENNSHIDLLKEKAQEQYADQVERYADKIAGMWAKDDERHVTYVEKRQGSYRELVSLKRCPVSVAKQLRVALFDCWPTVCTSATLAVAGSFDYFKSRVGCQEGQELVVGSPFDYRNNALIYLPQNALQFDYSRYQDNSIEYFDRLATEIERLLMASDGRAFCLFTSYKALNEVYGRIFSRLRWLVLKQGDAPRTELLRQFRENGHAVLFGLKSFWEGVDVRGEALSLVVIDKIPFAQPDDPVHEARCQEIKERSGNEWAWFNELAVPSAAIMYKQGFGRLIRTKSDWGVVALLDGRLTTKRYGPTILRSLPPGTQTRSIEAIKTFYATRTTGEPRQSELF